MAAFNGVIPGANWYSNPIPLGSSPYHISSLCNSRYQADISNECKEIPGDGYRVGDEV